MIAMTMKIDITWIKSLSYSDLALCNCLSQMRLYHYNLRYDVSKSIQLRDAEAPGIIKVTVFLITRDNEKFQLSYFMNQKEAETFRDTMIAIFTEYLTQGG